jgi:hypothetical protein
VIRALRLLLHHHRPTIPACAPGIRAEVCRCGAARLVDLHRTGVTAWATRWTRDVDERLAALRAYSRDGGR